MILKTYILSFDTLIALLVFIALAVFLPQVMPVAFAKDLFAVGISVLSIIFGMFFAALAFIMSATDNDLIKIMEEEGYFTKLIKTFEFTLAALFFSMVLAILIYSYSSYIESNGKMMMSRWIVILFAVTFSYSLIATLLATKDSIRYSKYRLMFMGLKKSK